MTPSRRTPSVTPPQQRRAGSPVMPGSGGWSSRPFAPAASWIPHSSRPRLRLFSTAGEDEVLRDGETAHAGQPLRPAPARDDPEVDLRLAELRRPRRVADV